MRVLHIHRVFTPLTIGLAPRICRFVANLIIFMLCAQGSIQGRTPPGISLSPNVILDDLPYKTAVHRVNQVELSVSNRGIFGRTTAELSTEERDVITGDLIHDGVQYPARSFTAYLGNVNLWLGAARRTGPVVSVGRDVFNYPVRGHMAPKDPPGEILTRNTLSGSSYSLEVNVGVSEEDFLCSYTDTSVIEEWVSGEYTTAKNQSAIGLSIDQSSFAWSYRYTEDFIIVDLLIRNINQFTIDSLYVGLQVWPRADLTHPRNSCAPEQLILGMMRRFGAEIGCDAEDTLSIAWHASVSGIPHEGKWSNQLAYDAANMCYRGSIRGAVGILPLEYPQSTAYTRFNWWGSDEFGGPFVEPSKVSGIITYQPDTRYINDNAERYRVLSTNEIDYSSYYASEVARAGLTDWKKLPIDVANSVSTGLYSPKYLVSWGPVTLSSGAVVPLTFAIVGGENLHVDPDNYLNLPHNPHEYEANLDFSDLHQNALMAQWLYDNPGIDTDGDGYKGEFRVCVRDSMLVNGEWVVNKADTQWYKGDGIPDYRGALPPPAPEFWLTPTLNGLHVRFNGQVTETEKDIFLQKPDFEGYRVYLGRDERESSLQLVGSYDLEDYDKYYLDLTLEQPTWQLEGEPYRKEDLRCLYGQGMEPCEDSTFEPLGFTQLSPYRHPQFPNDSVFWFKKHEYNASEYGANTPIKKRFPNVPDPRTLAADSITDDMYTEDGYLKFYEYEMTIENLLPTVTYWVNVTAFDYGSPAQGVNPLETERTNGVRPVYPLTEHDAPISGSEQVYVYPNPYRVDANYRADGYEGRNQDDRWDERVRAIWFANLPPVCTIHIHTIDGDRVRTMDHRSDETDPTHRRMKWDLINRNFQKVETGLYYWVVEVPGGKTQMGKLAIIR